MRILGLQNYPVFTKYPLPLQAFCELGEKGGNRTYENDRRGWTHVSIAKIGPKRIGACRMENPRWLVGITNISALWLIGAFSSVMDAWLVGCNIQ